VVLTDFFPEKSTPPAGEDALFDDIPIVCACESGRSSASLVTVADVSEDRRPAGMVRRSRCVLRSHVDPLDRLVAAGIDRGFQSCFVRPVAHFRRGGGESEVARSVDHEVAGL